GGREEYGHPGQEGPSTRSAPRSFSMSSPYVVFSGVRRHGAGSCVLTVRSPTETSGTRWTAMNGHHSEEPARVRQEVSSKKFRSASTVGIEKGGKSQGGCLVRSGVQLSTRAVGQTHPQCTGLHRTHMGHSSTTFPVEGVDKDPTPSTQTLHTALTPGIRQGGQQIESPLGGSGQHRGHHGRKTTADVHVEQRVPVVCGYQCGAPVPGGHEGERLVGLLGQTQASGGQTQLRQPERHLVRLLALPPGQAGTHRTHRRFTQGRTGQRRIRLVPEREQMRGVPVRVLVALLGSPLPSGGGPFGEDTALTDPVAGQSADQRDPT